MGAEADVDRLRSAITSLHKKIADLAMRSSKEHRAAGQARQRAGKATSPTTASSRLREAERHEKAAHTAEKRRADLERQLAARVKSLATAEARLDRERTSQLQTLGALERRMKPLEAQFRPMLTAAPGASPAGVDDASAYDMFISYASEDRDDVARPLADLLREHGLKVWFDELALAVGDGLRRGIDKGLSSSRFGVVILSPDFFRKGWAQAELDGLVARERAHGHKVVLPIWHRVTRDDVLTASPSLADKVALNSSLMTLEQIASSIASVVRPASIDAPDDGRLLPLQDHVEQNVDAVRAAVAQHGGRAVAVFGSVARGDARADSDIDFLVDFEDGRTLADLVALKEELEGILGRDVDVVSVGGLRGRDEEIPADAVWL